MAKTALVTGAGSGVGRAVAVALGHRGWKVALVGRRPAPLEEAEGEARSAGAPDAVVVAGDIGDPAFVATMSRGLLERWGGMGVVVNGAGTNVPNRSLEVLSEADYAAMINTNLHGPYYVTRAFLPAMRAAGSGTIVNIVSDAGKAASPKAGPGYVMSKFGLAGLTQSINAEERARGIRACAIFPGDIDTPLLEKRPSPPPSEARAKMLTASDVAACVLLAIELPDRAVVEELIIRPR